MDLIHPSSAIPCVPGHKREQCRLSGENRRSIKESPCRTRALEGNRVVPRPTGRIQVKGQVCVYPPPKLGCVPVGFLVNGLMWVILRRPPVRKLSVLIIPLPHIKVLTVPSGVMVFSPGKLTAPRFYPFWVTSRPYRDMVRMY